jgi:hypothetical protein
MRSPCFPVRCHQKLVVQNLIYLPGLDSVGGEFLLILVIEQERLNLDHPLAITASMVHSVYDVV